MKINKTNKNYSQIIIFILLITAVCGIVYFVFFNKNESKNTPNNNQNTSTPTVKEDTQENKTKIEQHITKEKTENTNSDQVKNTQINQQTNKYKAILVSSFEFIGKNIEVRGEVTNFSTEQGTCQIEMTGPSKQKINKTLQLLPTPQTTSCKTTLIDTSALEKGEWSYKLIFNKDNAYGESDEIKFQIK